MARDILNAAFNSSGLVDHAGAEAESESLSEELPGIDLNERLLGNAVDRTSNNDNGDIDSDLDSDT